jgi:hypothetical protein
VDAATDPGGADSGDASDASSSFCKNPQPLYQWGLTTDSDNLSQRSSGLELCEDESFHRTSVETCDQQYLFDDACSCSDGGAFVDGSSIDAGTCVEWTPDPGCLVLQGCMDDGDCASGEICLCSSGYGSGDDLYASRYNANTCVPANCQTDADCGGYECSASRSTCRFEGLYCHTSDDLCHGNHDCELGWNCTYSGSRWECTEGSTCD